MAKASSDRGHQWWQHQWRVQWQNFHTLVQTGSLSEVATETLNQLPALRRWSVASGWLLVGVGSALLLYWHGRLVLATGAGISVMMLIYLMHDWKLTLPWRQIRNLLDSSHQPIVLAVTGGGVATLSTYLAASIWLEAESAWMGLGALLQGGGTLAILVLLLGQLLNRHADRERVAYEQILAELTHANALKRLIAVRQLTHRLPINGENLAQQREIVDYFRLMLKQERDAIVRNAVVDGLQKLDRVQALSSLPAAELKPLAAEYRPQRQRHRVSLRQPSA